MSSSTHQAKRPYTGIHSPNQGQSMITTYFPTTNSSSPIYNANFTSSSCPTLPASVQSNLLSVGMRIRKSVPEGYKTGGYSAFTLFSDNNCHTLPRLSNGKTKSRSIYSNARRELTPFCGILKVGGLAQQELTGGNSSGDDEVPGEDDIPMLSSQGSTVSNFSVSSFEQGKNGNKRRFDGDEEELDTQVLQHAEIWHDEDLELSPKSKPVNQPWLQLDSVPAVRALAMPKSRKRIKSVRQELVGDDKGGTAMTGQENMMDFGEAEFLDYGVWKGDGGVREVVMGDA